MSNKASKSKKKDAWLWQSSASWWFQPIWKIVVKIGSSPQVGVNIKKVWNHHPDQVCKSWHIQRMYKNHRTWTNDPTPHLQATFWQKVNRCSVLIPTVAMTSINKSCRDSWVGCICKGETLNLEERSHPYHCHPIPSMYGIFSPAYIFSWFLWFSCRYIYQSHGHWICHVKHPPYLRAFPMTNWYTLPMSCVEFFRQVCVKLPLPKDQRFRIKPSKNSSA